MYLHVNWLLGSVKIYGFEAKSVDYLEILTRFSAAQSNYQYENNEY